MAKYKKGDEHYKVDTNENNISKEDIRILLNNKYEKKAMAKGYKYVEVLYENVKTLVFASPERQVEIDMLNKKFLEQKKQKANENQIKQTGIKPKRYSKA